MSITPLAYLHATIARFSSACSIALAQMREEIACTIELLSAIET